jgi:hypothetical protein
MVQGRKIWFDNPTVAGLGAITESPHLHGDLQPVVVLKGPSVGRVKGHKSGG